METALVKIFWLGIGMVGSLVAGLLSFIIRNAISRNATKESVEAKTDLLEKDISHIHDQGTDSV